MSDYGSLSTSVLIDLLFTAEDRVTADHIDEIVRRGEEPLPRLREILLNDDYWYEGQPGEFWIELHVVSILARLGDPAILPDLISRILVSCFADYDWMLDRWADVFSCFGESAVEPLIALVKEHRGGYRDGSDFSEVRSQAVRALTFIAHYHPSTRDRVLDFILDLLVDPSEDDRDLITSIIDCPLWLNRERSLEAVQTAYRRGVVDTGQAGTFRDLQQSVRQGRSAHFFARPLLDFHRRESIAFRQQIWKSPDPHARIEDLQDAGHLWIGSAPFPPPLSHFYPDPRLSPDYPPTPGAVRSTLPVTQSVRVGRNDPCPCGSGRKFKKCCDAVAAG
jgi:hypothetical protein